jgi:CO dehydrogenase maturation factor
MKIIVCGKGGCGKSTVTAFLAEEINRRGNKVLVIDTDESNFGLHTKLGMNPPQDFMNYFGGKKVLFEKVKTLKRRLSLDELPLQYLSEKENIKLLAIGKIYDFGEGCACPLNALSSKLLEVIYLKDSEFLIADTDAGIEHLGRGVDKGCDTILIVIDPSHESIKLANKITKLAKSINKRFFYVLNRVEEDAKKFILASIDKDKVIAILSVNKIILNRCLKGEKLDFKITEIVNLVDLLEKINRKERSSI